jgi:cation diffusion facilitator family transporter
MVETAATPQRTGAPAPAARYAWLSIGASVATLALKAAAWRLTGSVGLLSDAVESIVNLVAGVMALAMLTLAARPPDEGHAYGHSKAEYLASAAEGCLILVAAAGIAWTALKRLLEPTALEQVGLGLAVSVAASLVNLAVGWVLLQAGRRHSSIALEADAHHLFTDVWTSAGVLVGVGAVWVTGWRRLDPLVALIVAANIVWTGLSLLRRSTSGLLDAALSPAEQAAVQRALDRYGDAGIRFHAVLTRQAGARRFVSMHVLVPGSWTVARGHSLLEEIERDVRMSVPHCTVFTHLEPVEEEAAYRDQELDRDGRQDA